MALLDIIGVGKRFAATAAVDEVSLSVERGEFFALLGPSGCGTTFLVVTHDQEEALGMASRIAVMDRGRLVQIGAPAAIYERPNSRFVAGFVGSANLFEGEITAGFNRLSLAIADAETATALPS